jgi:serine/threonine-protein kinase
MSPEQLQGREVSVRSDIYALGLVLYELYTGRRAFRGKSLAELVRKHRDERPIEPSALVAGLDPAVERAILACLEKEPRRRPGSALVVSAMLTGSDPLEAAIAAGETPSPELVAAAGESEHLKAPVAWGLLALVLVGALLAPLASRSFQLLDRVPLEKSPAVLEDRAKELLSRMASSEAAIDDAWGLSVDWGYVTQVREKDASPGRWGTLASGSPPVLQFWYRRSPRPLVSLLSSGKVYSSKPGPDVTAMAGLSYGMDGRLLRFYAVPPQLEAEALEGEAGPPDWSPLFAEARLDPAAFRSVDPRWTPPFFADRRAAWEGAWPGRPDLEVRIEAAAHRGRPVWFEVLWPWTRPERMEKWAWPADKLIKQATALSLMTLLLGAAAFMARRNIVLGRGDRRGAFRVALVLVGLGLLSWALGAHHVGDWNAEVSLVFRGAGVVILEASFVWLLYLAVEPYARRLRPWTLVSWTRLLSGGVADPVVGRDVLTGLAWAVLTFFLLPLAHLVPAWLGVAPREPMAGYLDTLVGTGPLVSAVAGMASEATLFGMGMLLLFVLARLLLRHDALAAAAIAAVLLFPHAAAAESGAWVTVALSVAWTLAWVALLLRFGLLAAIVGLWGNDLMTVVPLTTDLSAWTAGPTLLVLPLVALLAVTAFRSALGGTGLRRYLAGEVASRP